MKADCSNLILGEACCINGAEKPLNGKGKAKRASAAAAATPRATAAGDQGGGVPYGWPGLNVPRLQMGVGRAKTEL